MGTYLHQCGNESKKEFPSEGFHALCHLIRLFSEPRSPLIVLISMESFTKSWKLIKSANHSELKISVL